MQIPQSQPVKCYQLAGNPPQCEAVALQHSQVVEWVMLFTLMIGAIVLAMLIISFVAWIYKLYFGK